jgi:hypothetical protein
LKSPPEYPNLKRYDEPVLMSYDDALDGIDQLNETMKQTYKTMSKVGHVDKYKKEYYQMRGQVLDDIKTSQQRYDHQVQNF